MRTILTHCVLIAASVSLAACGGVRIPRPQPFIADCPRFTRPAPAEPVGGFYFATSRLPDCREDRLQFTGYRDPHVSFGISDLPSQGDEPWKQHTSILLAKTPWRNALQRSIDADGNEGRLIVYVHGYYNNFEDALHRASNLRALNSPGVPVVVFSWPSLNRRPDYTRDEDSIAWAQDQLDELLLELSEMSREITIVSHSMGARAVLHAVERLDLRDPAKGGRVRRIVLGSPDIDRDQVLRRHGLFERLLRQPQRQILAYVSRHDRAIGLSLAVHGYARLGSSRCDYDVMFARRELGENGDCHLAAENENLAIVDTSDAVPTTRARHHDFVATCAGRADLAAFLRGEPIEWRQRIERTEETGNRLVGYRIVPERISNAIIREVCPPKPGRPPRR
jgi:esterase/lipase superfamily enzyme